jgi:hypothetical protein
MKIDVLIPLVVTTMLAIGGWFAGKALFLCFR